MERCPDPSILDAFAGGRIAPEHRAALEAHLDRCGECARIVATLASLFLSGTGSRDIPSIALAPTVASSPPPAPEPAAGALGRYRLIAQLGQGGMGVVYVAHDPELDRRVAVKLLHPDPYGNLETQRARLMREAQAMAKLSHPNVVAVHDVGRVGDRLFLAMELVEGATLTEWLRARPRRMEEILAMFGQAGRGLAAAHAVGLAHRDFKPDNVLVGADGRARVTDFGLARPLGAEAAAGVVAARHMIPALALHGATVPGALVGTPAYMAPEQLRGERADARSDQFAFSISLYEALFGARPFPGETLRELAANVLAGRTRPFPAAPRWIRALLTRGLAIDPAARYPSMDPLLAELARDHRRARRIAFSLAGMSLGAAALVGVMYAVTAGDRAGRISFASSAEPSSGGARCADVRLEVREAWTVARRSGVEHAFEAAYAERGYAARVAGVLDAFADGWAYARRAVCEAGDSREQAESRARCLDDGIRAVNALLTELEHADHTTLEHAMSAAEHLPPPSACGDPAALARRTALPAPDVRPRASLVEKELATIWARTELGHAADARKDAERLVSEAKAIGHAPLVAQAESAAAEAALADGDGEVSREHFERAAALAESAKDGDTLLGAAAGLVLLEGAVYDREAEASRWSRLGEAEAQRAGADARAAASFAGSQGAWRARAGAPRAAVEAYRHALAIDEKAFGEEHGDTASALLDLAGALETLGDHDEALEAARRARAIAEKRFGPAHPLVGTAAKALGDLLLARGDTAGAITSFRRAFKVRRDALRMYDPDVAQSEEDLGRALTAAGEYAEADKVLEHALRTRRDLTGSVHPDVGRSLAALAALRFKQGKVDDALAKHREAVAYLARVLDAGDPRLPEAKLALGDALSEAGREPDAVVVYRDAIAELTKRFGAESPRVTLARWSLGLALGKKAPARGLSELDDISLAVDAIYGWEHPRAAMLNAARARLELATGDRARAIQLYRVALAKLEKALGKSHADSLSVRRALEDAKKGTPEEGKKEPPDDPAPKKEDGQFLITFYEKLVATYEKERGADHPDTVAARKSLEDAKKRGKNSAAR